jgi:hypothetical protein
MLLFVHARSAAVSSVAVDDVRRVRAPAIARDKTGAVSIGRRLGAIRGVLSSPAFRSAWIVRLKGSTSRQTKYITCRIRTISLRWRTTIRTSCRYASRITPRARGRDNFNKVNSLGGCENPAQAISTAAVWSRRHTRVLCSNLGGSLTW